MRAIFFTGDQRAELDELPDPTPGRGEARLRVHASSICGTDLHRYRLSAAEREPHRRVVTGHEACGIIDAVGEGVDASLVGTRATVFQAWGCRDPAGPCKESLRPGSKRCPHATVMGLNTHGGNADYQIVPAGAVLPLPDDMAWADGVLLTCSFGTAFSAVEKTGVKPGESVIVWGLGPVGLCNAAILHGLGAKVTGVDPSSPRREQGARLDIEVVESVADDLLVDIEVDSTGNAGVQAGLTAHLAPEGRAVLIGLGSGESLGPNMSFILKELQVRGTMVFSREQWDGILRSYRSLAQPISPLLVNETTTPEDAPDAFTRAAAGLTSKVLIQWS